MKFIHYLERITDIEIYPLVSLLIFVLFFIAVVIWVIKMDRGLVDDMSHLPIDQQLNDSADQFKSN